MGAAPAKQAERFWNQRISTWAIAAAMALIPLAFLSQINDAFGMPKQVVLFGAATGLGLGLAIEGRRLPGSRRTKLLLAAAVVVELVVFAFSKDVLGSILGAHGWRLGLLTQLALLGLFAGTAAGIRSLREAEFLLVAGLVALAGMAFYGALQRIDADPFDWSAPGTVFSTFGNTNDFAEACVLALAPAGLLLTRRTRSLGWFWGLGALAVLAELVLWSYSRSGFFGLLIGLALTNGFARVGGVPLRDIARKWLPVTLGPLAVALLLAAATGDLGVVASRFARAAPSAAQGDELTGSFSIRLQIWRGEIEVIRANALVGVGQAGTRAEFDRERPSDLTGRFAQPTTLGLDPGLTSAHNSVLEVLSTGGVLGLLVVGGFGAWVGQRYWALLRSKRAPWAPYVGGAMFGYLACTLLNPLVLGNLAVFVVLAGVVVALAQESAELMELTVARRGYRHMAAIGAAGLAFAAAVAFGPYQMYLERLFIDSARVGPTTQGIDLARRAVRLMPWEQTYRRLEAQQLQRAGTTKKDTVLLTEALRREEALISDFQPLALDYLRLAQIRLALGQAGVADALAEAKRASPYGVDTARAIEQIEAQRLKADVP